MWLDVDLHGLYEPHPSRDAGQVLMATHPVDKELPWDSVTQTVAQTVVQHLPEATATEAYYHLVVQHLAHVLWRLGAGDQALEALSVTLRNSVHDVRARMNDASATTRDAPPSPKAQAEATYTLSSSPLAETL
jgi:predicted negative regulator of RcsB-dependent stress response